MGSLQSAVQGIRTMFSKVLGVVAFLVVSHSQALPFFPGQVYPAGVAYFTPVVAVPGLQLARQEFMQELDGTISDVISEITGQYLEDTAEVKEVKEEFMKVFNEALSGFIETVYLDDTEEVATAKKEFFEVFNAATTGLLTTVENFYIEDTAEVKDAREQFQRAFEDAKAGIIGAQYIPYTPAVQKARDEFLRFFDLVVDGMLYKLAPQPVANYYIADTPEVLELYKLAEKGDFNAALTVVALEDAISNNVNNPAGAAQQFVQTATELQDMIRILEGEAGHSLTVQEIEPILELISEESSDDTDDDTDEED